MPYGSISVQRMSDILPSATHQVTNSITHFYLKTNKTYTFRKIALTTLTVQYNSHNSAVTDSKHFFYAVHPFNTKFLNTKNYGKENNSCH
jgi:hypothetical protein